MTNHRYRNTNGIEMAALGIGTLFNRYMNYVQCAFHVKSSVHEWLPWLYGHTDRHLHYFLYTDIKLT